MSSHGFLLRRVWHLAIPTPPAMGYSPTEYAEFTEPPAEMSSHGFLLRRVWHLAIPTPPAMGYSPTEYAEFTEPPTEMSSHGFHRFTQILRVRCSPTEYAEFTEPPAEMSSHGFHRFTQILRVCCSPTEFGSVGMAGMPYPPTSVRICAICGRLFSARSFRAFCGNIFSPTDFTDLHRYLWCAVLPRNSQNSQNLSAWVWQGCHTLLICAYPCHLWEALLSKRFCVFGAFRGSFFTACSVGAAETAAPPGGIHGSSVHISPPHHLTTTTSFHLEPSLLHVLPVLWVRLRHYLRFVNPQSREHDCRRCERHRHAVVVVGVDRL